MITKPGCLLHGGSDGWKHNQIIPFAAMDKWEADFGWENQHHLQFIPLAKTGPKGIKLQIDVAKRVVEGGGYAQIAPWGTPEDLASVPIDWRDDSGHLVYPKYPPSDYEEWTRRYVRIVRAFTKSIDPERLWFNDWLEPNGWYWRSSDRTFYEFYNVVQNAIQEQFEDCPFHFGGVQIAHLFDEHLGRQSYTSTPTLVWTERFFMLAQKYGWRLDFVDLFQYSANVERLIGKILEVENLMLQYDIKTELIFNCLSSSYDDADYTMRLAKAVLTETGVDRAGFDFLEEVTANEPNGLLKYKTLEESERYRVARKILQFDEKASQSVVT